jgi:hypothetical protein
MNRIQRQHYAQAQKVWLERLANEHKWDYAITLQTHLKTYAVSAATRQQRIEAVEKATHRFKMRLNRLLTGNGWRRNQAYTPHFLSSIEGVDSKDNTLHIHASIGNVGHKTTEATRELLEQGIRQLWLKTNVFVPITPNLTTSPLTQVAKDDVKHIQHSVGWATQPKRQTRRDGMLWIGTTHRISKHDKAQHLRHKA